MLPKQVVALSGGKDSTAMALVLKTQMPEVEFEWICNETGDELPEMALHWARLEARLGMTLKRVRHERSLTSEVRHIQMLPNSMSRWCTRVLKIEPTIAYFQSLPKGSVLYVGLRADEELRRGLYGEDIDVRFPLRELGFTLAAVKGLLAGSGVCIPERTDCALCPNQRLIEWFKLWRDYPERYAEGVALEEQLGHTIRSPSRDTWPASLKELAEEFKRGRKIRKFKSDGETCRVCSL